MKIALLVCNNQYHSKIYFTEKFGEAMIGKGIEVKPFRWPNGPVPEIVLHEVKKWNPDLTFTFNQPGPDEQGLYFWDRLQIPNWTFLVDPAVFNRHLIKSRYSIVSCVDQNDCMLFHSLKFERLFFCPHAVEKELAAPENSDRIYDVVFIGTSYDPEGLRQYLKEELPEIDFKVFDEACEIALSEKNTTFFQATLRAITENELQIQNDDQFATLAYCVDSYTRGIDRVQLIRSIKDAKVHVFGGEWLISGPPRNPWSYYFANQPNVVLHQGVSFAQGLQILKQSKICLNSMPFFKRGSHERIFTGLACEALVLTTRNPFIEEQFEEGKEILFYDFDQLEKVNDLVNQYLHDDAKRKEAALLGREKVMLNHTWDNRVNHMLREIGKFG